MHGTTERRSSGPNLEKIIEESGTKNMHSSTASTPSPPRRDTSTRYRIPDLQFKTLTWPERLKFIRMPDEECKTWHTDMLSEMEKRLKDKKGGTTPPSQDKEPKPPPDSEKSDQDKRVNWRTPPVSNKCFTPSCLREEPHLVMDSGAAYTTFGKGWHILDRHEHNIISMQGPEQISGTVQMVKASAITKVEGLNGPVLLRAWQGLTTPINWQGQTVESLCNTDQVRCTGAKVHDLPHSQGGLQSMVFPTSEGETIIPLTYMGGNFTPLPSCTYPGGADHTPHSQHYPDRGMGPPRTPHRGIFS